ncbi:MAG: hypothetical protein WAU53_21480, partial [Rhodoplanes sp.]
VREKSLELWQRLWEPKIATLVNVHEHGRTLPLVAVGDNRIGKVRTWANNQRDRGSCRVPDASRPETMAAPLKAGQAIWKAFTESD